MRKLFQFIVSIIEISRPLNLIITTLAVWIGGIIAGGKQFMMDQMLLTAAIAAALVAAGGNAINDAYDEDVDEFNRPDRPIPSGRLSTTTGFIWGWFLILAGVIISFTLSQSLGIMAIVVALLLWIYSLLWKRTILLGNFAVAFCGAMAFMFGAVAVGNPTGGMYPALFAFLMHIGREIIKDTEDISGDGMWGVMTFPVVTGGEKSQRIAGVILAMLVIITYIPYQLGIFSINYLIIVAIAVDLPLLVIIVFLWRGLEKNGLERVSAILKLTMITGLVALYVG
ncbi:MAG: geranylgeranylglycerol-phosphate geranylgeranyltransferase [Candidatus Hatepunaea meridiana]|nr:geranylgeranylglycerol-phosphate geranylgeranyltransferase [Candidatus Hatepunaea meridiana]